MRLWSVLDQFGSIRISLDLILLHSVFLKVFFPSDSTFILHIYESIDILFKSFFG